MIKQLIMSWNCLKIYAKPGKLSIIRLGFYSTVTTTPFRKVKTHYHKRAQKSYSTYEKTDSEILEMAFAGHISERENGKKYVWNKIVYSGSGINKILSDIYDDPKHIPLIDFRVDRK